MSVRIPTESGHSLALSTSNRMNEDRDPNGVFVWPFALLLVVIVTDNVVIRLVLVAPLLLSLTSHVVLRSKSFSNARPAGGKSRRTFNAGA